MENQITRNDIIAFIESVAKNNNYDIASKEFFEFIKKEDDLATACEMAVIEVDYSEYSKEEYLAHKELLEALHIMTGLYFGARCYLSENYTY